MTIYADIMVLLNLTADYLLLLCVCKIVNIKPPFWRLGIGAAIGAAASFVILLPKMNFFLNLIIKSAVCIAMCLAAFPIKNLRSLIRYSTWLLCVTFAYCGIMTTVMQQFAPKLITVNNFSVYADLSPLLFVICTAICYLAVKAASVVAAKIRPKTDRYRIEIFRGDKSVSCEAILDTGCNLKDLFSGNPVIVLEKSLAMTLVPRRIAVGGNDDNAMQICEGIRLIPYSAIGGKGMMQAFCADRAVIMQGREKHEINELTVAISNEIFGGEYSALIGEELAGKL